MKLQARTVREPATWTSPTTGRTYRNPRAWRNPEALKIGIGWFDGALKQNMMSKRSSTDFDFIAEANNLFLLLEFKRPEEISGDAIQTGQWLTYARLAMTGLFTVYVVEYSDAGDDTIPPTITRVRRIVDDKTEPEWRPCSFEQLYALVEEWRNTVSNYPNAIELRKQAAKRQLAALT